MAYLIGQLHSIVVNLVLLRGHILDGEEHEDELEDDAKRVVLVGGLKVAHDDGRPWDGEDEAGEGDESGVENGEVITIRRREAEESGVHGGQGCLTLLIKGTKLRSECHLCNFWLHMPSSKKIPCYKSR